MTTTMRDCLPLARQLHPCHTIMAYRESCEPVIAVNVPAGETFPLPAYLVHTHKGTLKSDLFEINLTGQTIVYLVASPFEHFYYIIQPDGRCTCPKGRAERSCRHLERINQAQAVPDDDLMEVAV